MDDNILKIVYTFFLGIFIALFIGLGISTFYEGPLQPEYPSEVSMEKTPQTVPTEAQLRYETDMKQYQVDYQSYSRNVSIIALASSVLLLVVSFILVGRNKVMTNGIMLGGLFTLVYAIIRAGMSEDTKYTFVAVTVGLAVVIYLGYRRFGAAPKKSKRRR